jgi:tetratricopeptide (TPR) repeat protein
LDPGNQDAWAYRCKARLNKGEFSTAIGDCNEAIRLSPDDDQAFIRSLAYRFRSLANRLTGNGATALSDIEQAFGAARKSTTGGSPPKHAHAIDHYLRGNNDQAIAAYDELLRADAKDFMSLYGRGLAKRRKGDGAGGEADIAAARAFSAHVETQWLVYYGPPESVIPRAPSQAASQPPAPTEPATPTAPALREADRGDGKSLSSDAGDASPADCANAGLHWKTAEDIKTLRLYEDHLARFPTCEFAEAARARIEALKK